MLDKSGLAATGRAFEKDWDFLFEGCAEEGLFVTDRLVIRLFGRCVLFHGVNAVVIPSLCLARHHNHQLFNAGPEFLQFSPDGTEELPARSVLTRVLASSIVPLLSMTTLAWRARSSLLNCARMRD